MSELNGPISRRRPATSEVHREAIDQLAEVMRVRGISQAYVAEEVGLSAAQISRVFGHHQHLMLDAFLRVCDCLDVSAVAIIARAQARVEVRQQTHP